MKTECNQDQPAEKRGQQQRVSRGFPAQEPGSGDGGRQRCDSGKEGVFIFVGVDGNQSVEPLPAEGVASRKQIAGKMGEQQQLNAERLGEIQHAPYDQIRRKKELQQHCNRCDEEQQPVENFVPFPQQDLPPVLPLPVPDRQTAEKDPQCQKQQRSEVDGAGELPEQRADEQRETAQIRLLPEKPEGAERERNREARQ